MCLLFALFNIWAMPICLQISKLQSHFCWHSAAQHIFCEAGDALTHYLFQRIRSVCRCGTWGHGSVVAMEVLGQWLHLIFKAFSPPKPFHEVAAPFLHPPPEPEVWGGWRICSTQGTCQGSGQKHFPTATQGYPSPKCQCTHNQGFLKFQGSLFCGYA